MLRKLFVVLALCALALCPAIAQEEEGGGDQILGWGYGAYLGYMFGDTISEATFFPGALQPEVDDAAVIGGLVRFDISDVSRWEARLGFSPLTVTSTPNGDVDADLYYLDLGYVRRFELGSVDLGIPLGLGWGTLQEDDDFSDPGTIVDLNQTTAAEGGSGVTYFLGVQADFDLSDRLALVVDARIRRFHRLQNVVEQTAQMPEVSFAFVWSR